SQVERKLLPSECDSNIPVRVTLERDAAGEGWSTHVMSLRAVKTVGRSQEPMTYVAGNEPANAVRPDCRQIILCRAGQILPLTARIKNRRREEKTASERELIVHRIGGLRIDFPETQVGFDDVAIRQQPLDRTIRSAHR